MTNLFRITLLTAFTLFSGAVFAQTTTLTTLEPVSDAQIDKAIETLRGAKELSPEASRQSEIDTAVKSLAKLRVNVMYKAEVELLGEKQFEDQDSFGLPDIGSACFRGTPTEAAKLINAAIAQDKWNSDEEGVDSATVAGQEITLVVEDRPNEQEFEVSISACK